MAENKQSKRLVLTVAKDEWKIKNRFIGFVLHGFCLLGSPQSR